MDVPLLSKWHSFLVRPKVIFALFLSFGWSFRCRRHLFTVIYYHSIFGRNLYRTNRQLCVIAKTKQRQRERKKARKFNRQHNIYYIALFALHRLIVCTKVLICVCIIWVFRFVVVGVYCLRGNNSQILIEVTPLRFAMPSSMREVFIVIAYISLTRLALTTLVSPLLGIVVTRAGDGNDIHSSSRLFLFGCLVFISLFWFLVYFFLFILNINHWRMSREKRDFRLFSVVFFFVFAFGAASFGASISFCVGCCCCCWFFSFVFIVIAMSCGQMNRYEN